MAPKAGKTKPHKSKGEKKKKEEKGSSHYNLIIPFGSSTQNEKSIFAFLTSLFFCSLINYKKIVWLCSFTHCH